MVTAAGEHIDNAGYEAFLQETNEVGVAYRFDHEQGLKGCKFIYKTPAALIKLPAKFTLSQLQHLYEAVLGTELDKRNFRKKVLSFDLLVPLKETQMLGRHRPAQLFRFDAEKYEKLKKRGFNFEL